MIRKATPFDLIAIKELTEDCAVALQQKKVFQWNENYPSKEILEKDIQQEQLFVLEVDGEMEGIVVLTPVMDEEYNQIEWLTSHGNNLYVHRLATNPQVWGKGYGKKLMGFAEDFARKHSCTSVRLDTFSQNKKNQEFYESRGYRRLGNVYFPKQSEHPFFCYEKILD